MSVGKLKKPKENIELILSNCRTYPSPQVGEKVESIRVLKLRSLEVEPSYMKGGVCFRNLEDPPQCWTRISKEGAAEPGPISLWRVLRMWGEI